MIFPACVPWKIGSRRESGFETLRSAPIKMPRLHYSRSSAITHRGVALIPEYSASGRRLKRKVSKSYARNLIMQTSSMIAQ